MNTPRRPYRLAVPPAPLSRLELAVLALLLSATLGAVALGTVAIAHEGGVRDRARPCEEYATLPLRDVPARCAEHWCRGTCGGR